MFKSKYKYFNTKDFFILNTRLILEYVFLIYGAILQPIFELAAPQIKSQDSVFIITKY